MLTYLQHTRTAVRPLAKAKPTAPFNMNDISHAILRVALFNCQGKKCCTRPNQSSFLVSIERTDYEKHKYELITILILFM
jgi:hypothetical protein